MSNTPSRAQGAIGPLNDQLMNSAIRNLTRSRNKVVEFIEKEENLQRRQKLISIFHATKLIADRFEGKRASEVFGTDEYRDLCRPAFNLIREQRHAGRKLLFLSMSDPILGLDVLHFGWFPTIRGTSASQLSLMDPFLDQLKGIKQEPKPFCYNEPKSLPSKKKEKGKSWSSVAKGKKKQSASIVLKHKKFKSELECSIKNTFKKFNIPFQTLEHVIDTADLPNEFKHKVNVLVNINLVSENVPDAIIDNNNDAIIEADPVLNVEETAVKKVDEDGFWINTSDSDFDEQARDYNRSQLAQSRSVADQLDNSELSDKYKKPKAVKPRAIDIAIDRILKRFEDPEYKSPALGPLVPITDDSYYTIPLSEPVRYPGCYLDDITIPIPTAESTPGRPNGPAQLVVNEVEDFEEIPAPVLPRPNDSIQSTNSIGSADISAIHQPPLETPKPATKRLNRQLSMQPFARMASLNSDDESEKPAVNKTAPIDAAEIMEPLIQYIDKKFEQLEASFNK